MENSEFLHLDDEETIEEEENRSKNSDEHQREIEALKKESEMPLEQLLMLYSRKGGDELTGNVEDEEDDDDDSDDEDGEYDDDDDGDDDDDEDDDDECNREGNELGSDHKNKKTLFSFIKDSHSMSGDDDDTDFEPNIFGDKKIKIGDEHQASIPDLVSDRSSDTQSFDVSIWKPFVLNENEVLKYLQRTEMPVKEESRLVLLHECNYQIDEALKTCRDSKLKVKSMLLSEEENKEFEEGLNKYGKNFREIQENNLRNYKISELVNYYYIWKKSEKYDSFLERHKLNKKAQLINTLMCDYMEHLIFDREHQLKTAFEKSD
jgi:hypothetical protein